MRHLLIFFASVLLLSFSHPFYVSVCQIDHNAEAETLEITLKIFTADLEQSLEDSGADKLYLGVENESEKADELISRYLLKKFSLTINGRAIELKYLGKEVEMDAIWCYLEADNVAAFSNIEVTNKILIDDFEEQSNLVHIKVGGKKKSLLLNKSKTSGNLQF